MKRLFEIVAIVLSLTVLAPSALSAQALRLPPRVTPPLGVATETHPGILAACSESEPNEQTSNATPMSLPAACSGFVSSTDSSGVVINYGDGVTDGIEDLFVINLPVSMKLNIDVNWSNTGGDLDLFLLRPNGSSVATVTASTTNGSMPESISTGTLAAGTYYVGISAFSGSSNYNITVSEATTTGTCTENTTTVCLNNGRFRVRATYDTGNATGSGGGVRLSTDTGYFWFFGNANVEMVVKILDACSFNSRYWVFVGGLTDVGVTLNVTDTIAGTTKTYTNARGTAFKPIQDTDAFQTCGATGGGGGPCSVALTPASQSFGSSGGSGTINVSAAASCDWNATSNASWITIQGVNKTGNGSVSFSVPANTGSARSGTISIGDKTATISQSAPAPACTYGVSPSSASYPSSGGSGSIDVSTIPGCTWTANSNAAWLTITGGSSGSGPGTTTFSVAANSGSARSGTMTIAGQVVTISQGAAAPASYDGTWTGTTSQGKTFSFVVSANKIMSFTLGWHATGSCGSVDGTTTTSYGSGISIVGTSFAMSSSGPTININGSFSSANNASGTFSVTYTQPFPSCSASGSGSFSVTKP